MKKPLNKDLETLLNRYSRTLQLVGDWEYSRIEYSRRHLLQMIAIMLNKEMSWGKFCRWLGYIQGCMASHKYLVVQDERNLTREFLPELDGDIQNEFLV